MATRTQKALVSGSCLVDCYITDENVYPYKEVLHHTIGHIGIAVPDVYKACERFEKLGVNFVKKPDGGESSLDTRRIMTSYLFEATLSRLCASLVSYVDPPLFLHARKKRGGSSSPD